MKVLACLWSTAREPAATALFAASAAVLLLVNSAVKAQPPIVGPTVTVQGTVRSSTTAPMGEVDGAVLEDGTVIHWPPHLAPRFSSVAARGDQVRATGWMETGPEGDTHLELRTITNLRTNASIENDAPAPPPPPIRGPGRRRGPAPPPPGPRPVGRVGTDTVRSAQGTVQRMTSAPAGEIDGAVLDDGTVIHWPPHMAEGFSAVVVRGERIKVSGWMETGPGGDTHLEVQSATNLRTNATVGTDDARPLRPLSDDVPPEGSSDFLAPAAAPTENVERRLKALEDQIAQLRAEIRRLRGPQ
jgi:hypothetical protein